MPRVGWKHSPETIERVRKTKALAVPPVADRFHSRYEYDTNGGCWLWSGAMPQQSGYGTLQAGGQTLSAHRVSYELHHGPIPPGLVVRHKCDVRACVNPQHLLVGSHFDNMVDTIVRGRRRVRHGDAHRNAKIKSKDVPRIRGRLAVGESCASIAKDFGVDQCAINALRRGRTWWHVPGIEYPQSEATKGGGEANNLPAEVAP